MFIKHLLLQGKYLDFEAFLICPWLFDSSKTTVAPLNLA